ncbi:rod shape-determining protein [Alicyclobacillus sp. SO9]|uniref:rod shape-determining protein n=1 Tax=Alicyclobacillus sp. SO9 TaxID=2665646 RepID=UPI0018E708B6|nr:rod shape-determining protein [Alicyclobacillus sp. SO9]QQE79904.1 rod shape-determining protein [Alicyclobacillus sp. SO9]
MNIFIDLGTSHFRAGTKEKGVLVNEPSVVAYRGSQVIVGTEANRMIGRIPRGIRLAYPVEDGIVKDLDAAVDTVKYIIGKCSPSKYLNRYNIVFSSPWKLTDVEKGALKEAASAGTSRRVEFVDASVAAALGAELPIEDPTGCMIVNLGGGTTEVSILSMGGVVHSRRQSVGGKTIDDEIVELLRKEYRFTIGQPSAERLKHLASAAPGEQAFEVSGRNLMTRLPGKRKVDEKLLQKSLESYVDTIQQLIVEALESCPPELIGDIVDRGIMLVGGGAHSQYILERMRQRIEIPVVSAESPDLCIIRGLMRYETGETKGRFGRLKQNVS